MRQKITTLFIAILLGTTTYAQNCNIGNQTKTAAFGKDSEFGTDFIMGIKQNLSSQATLRAINMIGNNTVSSKYSVIELKYELANEKIAFGMQNGFFAPCSKFSKFVEGIEILPNFGHV